MKLRWDIFFIVLFVPILGSAQRDSISRQLDSVNKRERGLDIRRQNEIDEATFEGAKLDLSTYFTLLADDLKQQTTAPFHTSAQQWVKVGKFAILTAGVALLNKPINQLAVKVHDENKAVASVSRYVTNFGGAYEVYAMAGFYAYGLFFKSEKAKTTTALATQAYITAGIISTIAKYITGEQRPYYTDPNYNKSGPIFRGPIYPFKKNVDLPSYSSFPSGHTTAAFAAATVYALEYRDKPLVPILSYTAASLIGLSRLTENKHWATDVLVGAMLGYLSGKQVVNNYHRYSEMRNGKKTRASYSLNLQYQNKQFQSGVIYNF
jgi:membrane-associated phospholipid phosphatase